MYASKKFQDDWSEVNNRQTFIDTNRHLLIPINQQKIYTFLFVNYTFS